MLRHLVKAAIDDRVGVVIYKIKIELKNVVCSMKLADDIFIYKYYIDAVLYNVLLLFIPIIDILIWH